MSSLESPSETDTLDYLKDIATKATDLIPVVKVFPDSSKNPSTDIYTSKLVLHLMDATADFEKNAVFYLAEAKKNHIKRAEESFKQLNVPSFNLEEAIKYEQWRNIRAHYENIHSEDEELVTRSMMMLILSLEGTLFDGTLYVPITLGQLHEKGYDEYNFDEYENYAQQVDTLLDIAGEYDIKFGAEVPTPAVPEDTDIIELIDGDDELVNDDELIDMEETRTPIRHTPFEPETRTPSFEPFLG